MLGPMRFSRPTTTVQAACGLRRPQDAHPCPLDQLRLQRGAAHLHCLGPRATLEFLLELAGKIGGLPVTSGLLAEYQRKFLRYSTPPVAIAFGSAASRSDHTTSGESASCERTTLSLVLA